MHFHLPKPIHGWREFVGEVAIIVIGVLIAIGAEEMVQAAHWRHLVAEAQESLNAQLLGVKFATSERIKKSECYDRQLDRVDALIARPEVPQNMEIVIGGLRIWPTSSWDAAVASGAVAHMPPEMRQSYAEMFAFTAVLGKLNQEEFSIGRGLKTLERHTKLNDISRDRLAQEVAQMRGINHMLTLGANQWLEEAKGLHLDDFGPEDRKALETPSLCQLPGDGRAIAQ